MIVLEQIAKTYPGRRRTPALVNINLTVHEGEFVAVVGPSGSGKSTLMNILGLLDRPSEGRYWLQGNEVQRWSDRRLASLRNRTIGFVFQSFNLVPTLTARENVELPLVYRNVPPRRRREVADYWLRKLGLDHRLDYRPHELSGGQQQRAAVARAMAAEPRLLLADEPTGNLDEKTSQEMMRVFKQVQREGQTVVLITHNSDFAAMADRVVRIEGGQLASCTEGRSHAYR